MLYAFNTINIEDLSSFFPKKEIRKNPKISIQQLNFLKLFSSFLQHNLYVYVQTFKHTD